MSKLVSLASLLLLSAWPINAAAVPLLKQHVERPLQAEAAMSALEPWETPIEGFFVRSHFDTPVTDANRWTIVVDGLVDHPRTFTLAELRKLAPKSLHAVLECSGNGRALQQPKVPGVQWERGAVGNAGWSGVTLRALLAMTGIKPEARFITVTGADKPARPEVPGFTRSIPLAKAQHDDTLLALQMNGEAVPLLHGGPLRLVLPGWYGENWVKWVTKITLTATEDHGFFMKKAYRMPRKPVQPGEAWDSATGTTVEQILVQSIIVSPVEGEQVARGELTVRGKAFSGAGVIQKVELSSDGGKTWKPVSLELPHADGGWQEFTSKIPTGEGAKLVLMSRATDAAGNVQPLEHTWNPSGYLRNAVDQVTVAVNATAASTGSSVLEEKCTICHARAMIESQRLTPKQWAAVAEKMKSVYGASLNSGEQEALLAYLQRFAPEQAPAQTKPLVYGTALEGLTGGRVAKSANATHGARLFKDNCAACHGPEGDGGLGPRLRHRAMGADAFRSTVMHGKNVMPAFGKLLLEKDVEDLRAYLLR